MSSSSRVSSLNSFHTANQGVIHRWEHELDTYYNPAVLGHIHNVTSQPPPPPPPPPKSPKPPPKSSEPSLHSPKNNRLTKCCNLVHKLFHPKGAHLASIIFFTTYFGGILGCVIIYFQLRLYPPGDSNSSAGSDPGACGLQGNIMGYVPYIVYVAAMLGAVSSGFHMICDAFNSSTYYGYRCVRFHSALFTVINVVLGLAAVGTDVITWRVVSGQYDSGFEKNAKILLCAACAGGALLAIWHPWACLANKGKRSKFYAGKK